MTKTQYLLASAVLALAGCAASGSSVITSEDMSPFYSPQVVNYTAANGEFPTAVFGNPFGPDADDALLEGMSIPPGFSYASLKAIPKGKRRNDGHFVFIFDPERLPGGRVACSSPETVTLRRNGPKLRVQGAFCYDDEMASEAVLTTKRPARPDDPKFRAALDLLMAVILKPYNDQRRDGLFNNNFLKWRFRPKS